MIQLNFFEKLILFTTKTGLHFQPWDRNHKSDPRIWLKNRTLFRIGKELVSEKSQYGSQVIFSERNI